MLFWTRFLKDPSTPFLYIKLIILKYCYLVPFYFSLLKMVSASVPLLSSNYFHFLMLIKSHINILCHYIILMNQIYFIPLKHLQLWFLIWLCFCLFYRLVQYLIWFILFKLPQLVLIYLTNHLISLHHQFSWSLPLNLLNTKSNLCLTFLPNISKSTK